MKPPRFRLSTLCLTVALVALVLGYGWQTIENSRLRARLERARMDAAKYVSTLEARSVRSGRRTSE
jgi:hypothetical protein